MYKVDCYDFFKLALNINPLTTSSEGEDFSELWPRFYFAKAELLSFFNVFPLKTCQAAARALYQYLLALVPDDFGELRTRNTDGSPRVVESHEAAQLRLLSTEFVTVLKAELGNWDVYFVSQKGAFNTADLINNAETMLPPVARALLNESALTDVRQCGRSIAFNMGTAAAFHIVRAAETFIWRYYATIVGHVPAAKTRNWGAYLMRLEKSELSDQRILGWIRQIKNQYRNPVLHPDQTVSPEDAMEFVSACVSLMTVIARVLPAPELAPAIDLATP